MQHLLDVLDDDPGAVIDLDLPSHHHLDLFVGGGEERYPERLALLRECPPFPTIAEFFETGKIGKALSYNGEKMFLWNGFFGDRRKPPDLHGLPRFLDPRDISGEMAVVDEGFGKIADDPLAVLLDEDLVVDQLVDHLFLADIVLQSGLCPHYRPAGHHGVVKGVLHPKRMRHHVRHGGVG